MKLTQNIIARIQIGLDRTAIAVLKAQRDRLLRERGKVTAEVSALQAETEKINRLQQSRKS